MPNLWFHMMKPLVIVAAAPVLPVLWLLAQAGSNAPAPVSLPFENMGQVWLAGIFIIGQIVKHVLDQRATKQARKWMIEDQKLALESAEKEAKRIREDLIREAERIEKAAWERADSIRDQIAENTKLTTDVGARIAGGLNALPGGQQVPVKVTPMPDRRPGDSAPLIGRRETDLPPVPPTRRDADEKEKE